MLKGDSLKVNSYHFKYTKVFVCQGNFSFHFSMVEAKKRSQFKLWTQLPNIFFHHMFACK